MAIYLPMGKILKFPNTSNPAVKKKFKELVELHVDLEQKDKEFDETLYTYIEKMKVMDKFLSDDKNITKEIINEFIEAYKKKINDLENMI